MSAPFLFLKQPCGVGALVPPHEGEGKSFIRIFFFLTASGGDVSQGLADSKIYVSQFQGSLAAQAEEDATGMACSIEVFMISTPQLNR